MHRLDQHFVHDGIYPRTDLPDRRALAAIKSDLPVLQFAGVARDPIDGRERPVTVALLDDRLFQMPAHAEGVVVQPRTGRQRVSAGVQGRRSLAGMRDSQGAD